MDQLHDRTGTPGCAKETLQGWTRRGGVVMLILSGVLASLLLVDPPIPIGSATPAPSYVPASDRWIELGSTGDEVSRLTTDLGNSPTALPKGV